MQVCGFETSPYGIEWMRCKPNCDIPDVVRSVPHIAFVVDDLEEALEGREILIEPNSPSRDVRVAFIFDDGAPVELLEFRDHERTGTARRPAGPRSRRSTDDETRS